MDWRHPADDFGRQLASAYEAILANQADPWKAVEPFEPILEELRIDSVLRERHLPRVRSLGRELFERLRSLHQPVAMEVRHYCWHLQYLGDFETSSGIRDMFMITITRFAMYANHQSDQCTICKEYPEDLPHRNGPEGRAHFYEWLRKKGHDPHA
jgi:hypothetical protein